MIDEFDPEKYNRVEREMIGWYQELYETSVFETGTMSDECLDMYYQVGRYVLDSPFEMDNLIHQILVDNDKIEKTEEQLKIEEQQNKIDELEKKFQDLINKMGG